MDSLIQPVNPSITLVLEQLRAFYFPVPHSEYSQMDLYTRLNLARTWFNSHVTGFTMILEDVWNEAVAGQTTIDYQLRSQITKDESLPLASDIYLNRKDTNGVWHLEGYQGSVMLVDDSLTMVKTFLLSNGWEESC